MTKRILIMAGGTGGHVFPALAVGRRLQKQGWEVHWLGTKEGLEAKLVPTVIPIHYVSVHGLRRKGMRAWCTAPFQLCRAFYQSLRIILKLKPNVVLGMGGFVAGPGGLAAWVLRCPLIIHEQNAIVGMTNHWLSFLSRRVLEAFPHTFPSNIKAICTGNPAREELLGLPLPKERFKDRQGPLRLLVLGGSRGAEALNQLCPLAMQKFPKENCPEIWHQSGRDKDIITQKAYEMHNIKARVEPFIEDMAKAYCWADIVLCRAGALTITELATVGVGSLLIPYPFAVDDHQTRNGYFLEAVGAAELMQQSTLSAEKLAAILLGLSEDRDRLLKMAEAAYKAARRDALTEVTKYCEEIGCHAV